MESEQGDIHETEKTPLLRSEQKIVDELTDRAERLAAPRGPGNPGGKRKLSKETREKYSRLAKERQEKLVRLRALAEVRKKKAKAKEELVWRKRHESIRYYAVRPDGTTKGPHSKQDAFHRSDSQIRVASGGNRSGKSTGGINEDVAYALGYRPWLQPDDPKYKVNVRVPNKGLICGESFQEQVDKVLIPKLLGDPENGVPGAIPTNQIDRTAKNPMGVVVYIRLKNGSEIFMQSYDQKVSLFESADYDWVHFDEPPPRAIWIAVQRGLTDRLAPCWLTMTPLKEPWLYDEVYNRKDCDVHYFDIEDNLNFGLSRQGIDQFAANLTEDEKEARLRGKFFHLTGLVYKAYGPVHRLKREKLFPRKIPRHYSTWLHIDCHPRKPHHAVYITIGPDRRKIVCGELKNMDKNNRIEPFCEALRVYQDTVLGVKHEDIEKLIDPLSGTPNPVGEGLSIWDEFDRCGFTCRPGSKSREAGILLLQNELKHDIEAGIYPTIYFLDDLVGVDYEMRHYIWDDHVNKKSEERKDQLQAPRKKHDDYIEGIHRILLAGADYEEPYDDEPEERPAAAAGANPFTNY
jgi:hypothetical protein